MPCLFPPKSNLRSRFPWRWTTTCQTRMRVATTMRRQPSVTTRRTSAAEVRAASKELRWCHPEGTRWQERPLCCLGPQVSFRSRVTRWDSRAQSPTLVCSLGWACPHAGDDAEGPLHTRWLSLWLASGQMTAFPSGKKREFRFHPIKETVVEEPVDITPYLDQLDESLRDKVLQLQKGRCVRILS